MVGSEPDVRDGCDGRRKDVTTTGSVEDTGLVEANGGWLLPLGNGVVTQLRIDFAFTLMIEAWLEIRIQTAFVYGIAGNIRPFDPEQAPALAPLLDRHQARVTVAEIRPEGRLSLTFADQAVLTVEPDDRHEAFSVVGQRSPRPHFLIVAAPDGGLAHW
jgi:hypothetical protein